jgi:ribosome-binding protein aMBF1 (putative translation factor)
MDNQDWTPTVVTRSGAAALPKGGPREIRERQAGSSEAARLAKLAAADDIKKPKVLSRDSVTTIQNYRRQNNNLTQKQLDQLLSFPPNSVNKLEARLISPTGTQLNALNRLLKTGLTLE